MRRQLSYVDALKLLGPVDSKVIQTLGKIAGGALLVAAAFGLPQALALLDARTEVAELGQKLINSLSEKLSGRSRHSRTERLLAAHSIIVVTAFFDALTQTQFPFDLTLQRSDQLAITAGRRQDIAAGDWIAVLTQTGIPVPTPQSPFDETIRQIANYYGSLFDELITFMKGLAVWESADNVKRTQFINSRHGAVRTATQKYQELYHRLAADCLEFFFWANLQDHQATRAMISVLGSDIEDRFLAVETELRNLQTGFGAVTSLTAQMGSIGKTSRTRDDLRRMYQRQLDEPAADFDTFGGAQVPPLSASYINPRCRIRTTATTSQPGDEKWWGLAELHDDLQGFLLGFLTSPEATSGPLVVLGQPGSGKSVFTRVLAAGLSVGDFLPIRVELRRVRANAPIQTQIEDAVRELTGASLDWPDLVAVSHGALPVVLFDGYDELLQASGISKSDYLEQVRDFQRREEYLGRPSAVIVTSRLAVADRARFPEDTVVIRLEEFDDAQISRWVTTWNTANSEYFARSHLAPVPIQAILAHAELSAQPLLLLMLALYDSENNTLQRVGVPLSRSQLYKELLTNFARREVVKRHANLLESQITQLVDLELDRLAIFACAMFNRTAQSATEQQLTADLESLLPEEALPVDRQQDPGRLSPAQLAVGRFYFFVYESQASFGRDETRTYEFMHATFAEYLIARIVVRVLNDLGRPQSHETAFLGRRSRPEADLLYALLSFVPLTTRSSIVSFLEDMVGELSVDNRERARQSLDLALELTPQLRPDRAFASYSPAALSAAAREAAYTANLVILLTAIGDQQETTVTELLPGAADPIQAWRSTAYLWKSQMAPDHWQAFIVSFRLQRIWDDFGRQDLRLMIRTGMEESPAVRVRDLSWWHGREFGPLPSTVPRVQDPLVTQFLREAWFLCDPMLDHLAHTIDPIIADAGPQIGRTVSIRGVGLVSMANVLAWLRLSSHRDWHQTDLLQLYQAYLEGLNTAGSQEATLSADLVAAQLCEDLTSMPAQTQVEFADTALSSPTMAPSSPTVGRESDVEIGSRLSWSSSATSSAYMTAASIGLGDSSVYASTRDIFIRRLAQRALVNLDSLIARLRK